MAAQASVLLNGRTAFTGERPLQARSNNGARRAQVVTTTALFSRKSAVVAEPEPVAAPKKGLFGLGGKKTIAKPEPVPAPKKGLFGLGGKKAKAEPKSKPVASKKIDKAAELKKRQGVFANVLGALDFNEVRSKADAELLYDAKYGKLGDDGRMSREQYAALRRRVGGTANSFFKEWVDVRGDYVEKGYVSTESSSVVGLPILLGTVVGMLLVLGYVVANT